MIRLTRAEGSFWRLCEEGLVGNAFILEGAGTNVRSSGRRFGGGVFMYGTGVRIPHLPYLSPRDIVS